MSCKLLVKLITLMFLVAGTNSSFATEKSLPGSNAGFPVSASGYPLGASVWFQAEIPVCWEDFDDSVSTHRNWVRSAVENSWQHNSGITFTGWGQCGNNSKGIRIRVADMQPNTVRLGRHLDGKVSGMTLNFTFGNWCSGCKNKLQRNIESIAVHEFGHALGFAHEHNREDTPDSCRYEHPKKGTDGDIVVGEWDIRSVMNYCNPTYNGNGQLSETDIQMVQTFYPVSGTPAEEIILNRYYTAFLKRVPDAAGFQYWTNQIRNVGCNSYSLANVVKSFIASNEFTEQLDEYGDPHGVGKIRRHTETIIRLYHGALKRHPDRDGLVYWNKKLSDGELTLSQVTDLVVTSPEFESKVPGWCTDI